MSITSEHIRRLKVLLVDPYPVVRLGLQHLIDASPGLEVAASASTRLDANTVLQSSPIDVVVTSLTIGPRDEGLELLDDVKENWPQIPAIVLSGKPESGYALRAFHHGAKGYVEKNRPPAEIVRAITSVATGGVHLSQAASLLVVTSLREYAGRASGRNHEGQPSNVSGKAHFNSRRGLEGSAPTPHSPRTAYSGHQAGSGH